MKNRQKIKEYKIGDSIIIIRGPEDQIGRIGNIHLLAINGAIITFPNGSGMGIKFENFRPTKYMKESAYKNLQNV